MGSSDGIEAGGEEEGGGKGGMAARGLGRTALIRDLGHLPGGSDVGASIEQQLHHVDLARVGRLDQPGPAVLRSRAWESELRSKVYIACQYLLTLQYLIEIIKISQ